MKDTFKDQLVLEPLLANAFILPSPEELKGRILVKVKTCDETEGDMRQDSAPSFTTTGRKRSSSSPFTRSSVPDGTFPLNFPPLSSPPLNKKPRIRLPFLAHLRLRHPLLDLGD